MRFYVLTAESVSEGHPDKIADQISDAILDTCIVQDKNARVACETLISGNKVIIAGEISANLDIRGNIPGIVHRVITEIGYTDPSFGFDLANSCTVQITLNQICPAFRNHLIGLLGHILHIPSSHQQICMAEESLDGKWVARSCC